MQGTVLPQFTLIMILGGRDVTVPILDVRTHVAKGGNTVTSSRPLSSYCSLTLSIHCNPANVQGTPPSRLAPRGGGTDRAPVFLAIIVPWINLIG